MRLVWEKFVQIPQELIRELENKPRGTHKYFTYTVSLKEHPLEIIDMSGCIVCKFVFYIDLTVEKKEYPASEARKYVESQDVLSELVRFNVEVDGREVDIDVVKNSKGIHIETSRCAANIEVTIQQVDNLDLQ